MGEGGIDSQGCYKGRNLLPSLKELQQNMQKGCVEVDGEEDMQSSSHCPLSRLSQRYG